MPPAASKPAPLDPERIITVLAKHGVRFVLIGALAARLHGFPRVSADADITPARDPDNLKRLAAALRELDARITSAGRLDMAFAPPGTTGYDDLAKGAVPFDVYGVQLLAARLEDIIRSKEAAARPQDRQDVVVMREMLRRRKS